MNHPDAIVAMFDKRESHRRMQAAQIAVPRALGPIASYEELLIAMRREHCLRVFIKLAHGSSASGTVALQVSQRQQQAISTVEMVEHAQGLRLYNTRRLRTYRDPAQIARLIDTLCQHVVHVEQWLPKAGINNQTFDLRVMVIAGRARHVVVRMSNGPMTNLHLLNKRGNLQQVLEQIAPEIWAAACQACVAALNCFPKSLYAGVDLLIQPDFERFAILEINAFGDLLPGILYEQQDTYGAEIAAYV